MSEPSAPPTVKKTVLEVYPDTHARVTAAAAGTTSSVKRFSSLILDWALGKYEKGEIEFREPAVEETDKEAESK